MEWGNENGLSVLFVCLGNICRSPMAEGAFRKAAAEAGLEIEIDSAGTAGYHIGEPPDPRAIKAAGRHGVDISGGRGRQLCEQDFDRFTHIFALDSANLAGIEARAPRHGRAKVAMLLDVLEDHEGASVDDPYYGDQSSFDECWELVSSAANRLAEKLAARAEAPKA